MTKAGVHVKPEVAPVRNSAEALLGGRRPDAGLFEAVQKLVSETLEPPSDLHASADYRREVAGVLARRALSLAWKRASDA